VAVEKPIQLNGHRKRDEHPVYTLFGIWHPLLFVPETSSQVDFPMSSLVVVVCLQVFLFCI